MPGSYLQENNASLFLDNLNLLGKTATSDGFTFELRAQADSATWGNPVPITSSVQRWMADGAIAAITGWGNRNPAFKLFMYADTSEGLAAAERELVKAARRASELKWVSTEGAPDAAVSVFDVQTVQTDFLFAAEDEQRLVRGWQITIEAWPWVRGDNLITFDALAVGVATTLTLVDACSTASGWTGSPNAATASGGAVRETAFVPVNGHGNHVGAHLTRTGVVGMGATPYLVLDMAVTGGTTTPEVFLDGTPASKVAQIGTVSYWLVPVGMTSFTTLHIATDVAGTKGKGVTLSVNQVLKTDTIDPTSTRKQLIRSISVGGSMPTSGSIKVASPDSTPLGTVMVVTRTDDGSGFGPNMRQWRSGGGTPITDVAAISGKKDTIVSGGTGTVLTGFTLPPGVVREASYDVVGRWYPTAVGSMSVTLTGGITGTGFSGYGLSVLNAQLDFSTINAWQYGVIGTMTLPQSMLPAESLASTFLTLYANSGVGTVYLDDLWLIDKTRGAVSLIDCGPTATRLWLDSPSVDRTRNRPGVYTGTLDDRTDAAGVPSGNIKSLGQHLFDPDGEIIFTACEVANASVSGSFFRAGHSNIGNRG